MKGMESLQAEKGTHGSVETQVVVFRLGKEEYAIDILQVQEIIRVLNVTRIPRVEKHIEGVINLRGNIVPLLNLHTKFNLQISGLEEERRIIVCQFDEIKAGIIVDEVLEVITLSERDIESVDNVYTSVNAEQIKGVAKVSGRLLILPDMKKIILGEAFGPGE
ncbi:positive regulator of chea protein activity (chew) [hydrocarbon metagenome]|uniref:Positive regulator of chea protein activity (Chew) n=1 Tax=hydrocarbon metagenome TaxID=938273 RepID=A0A0W8E4N2_9ZZZZ